MDTARSVVRWRGTKLRGHGRHEGVVPVRAGELLVCGPPDGAALRAYRTCGGRLVVDVARLAVTDIPAHEPVPRQNLTEHLLGPDFLWTARWPTATFVFAAADVADSAGAGTTPVVGARAVPLRVVGDLTIRDVTHRVALPAALEVPTTAEALDDALKALRSDVVHARARFRIDRRRWGVAYRWDPIRNQVVDDDVTLEVELVAAAGAP